MWTGPAIATAMTVAAIAAHRLLRGSASRRIGFAGPVPTPKPMQARLASDAGSAALAARRWRLRPITIPVS
jgi:hypothetical protein